MKQLLRMLCILMPVVFATSCLEEEMGDCPPEGGGLWITFDMLNTSLQYTEEVRHVYLFFYEPTTRGAPGDLVKYIQYNDRDELRAGDYAAFVEGLPPGDYHLLAVSNCAVYTLTQDYEQYETVFTSLDNYLLSSQPICFMTGEIDLTILPNTQQTENVTLLRHNNDIHVNLHYDGYSLPDGMALDARINGNNAEFEYLEHATVSDLYANYADWGQTYDPRTGLPTIFDLTTMRICHERTLNLYVEEIPANEARADVTGRQIVVDIAGELAELTDENGNHPFDTDSELEHWNEYSIDVTLDGDFTVANVSVTVTGWDSSGGSVDI